MDERKQIIPNITLRKVVYGSFGTYALDLINLFNDGFVNDEDRKQYIADLRAELEFSFGSLSERVIELWVELFVDTVELERPVVEDDFHTNVFEHFAYETGFLTREEFRQLETLIDNYTKYYERAKY